MLSHILFPQSKTAWSVQTTFLLSSASTFNMDRYILIFFFEKSLQKLQPTHVISLQNDKILDRSKLKASPGGNLNLVKIMICLLHRVQNIVGKAENAA